MDTQKARDILRHITRDDDNGIDAMRALTVAEVVEVYSIMLPTCIEQAIECEKEADEDYFKRVREYAYAVAIEKLSELPKRWIVYDSRTGYPYMVGDSMIVIYDFLARDKVMEPLIKMGYEVTLMPENEVDFKNEVAHMYRNGYSKIQFVGSTPKTFVTRREDFAAYEDFYGDDYITNPGLQAALIRYFQEAERSGDADKNQELIGQMRAELDEQYMHAEYMAPCAKIETEDEITFVHPPIDLTAEIVGNSEGKKVVAIPVFTDGFEMDKCFTGERENMVYNIHELKELIEEIGVDGFVLNYMGQRIFMNLDMIAELCESDKKTEE